MPIAEIEMPFSDGHWLGPWRGRDAALDDIEGLDLANCRLPYTKPHGQAAGLFVRGPMLAGHCAHLAKLVESASGDDDVHRIVILCNSPFGQCTGLAEAVNAIRRAGRRKECWSYLSDACGPAFLIGLAATHVFASSKAAHRYGGCRLIDTREDRAMVSPWLNGWIEDQISGPRIDAHERMVQRICRGVTVGFEQAEAAELIDMSLNDPHSLIGERQIN